MSGVWLKTEDWGNKKITINAVAPGGIVTDMSHATAKDYLSTAENMIEQQNRREFVVQLPFNQILH